MADVCTVLIEFQKKFLKLKNDLSAQNLYKQSHKKIWSSMLASYLNLSSCTIRFLCYSLQLIGVRMDFCLC